MPCDTEYDVSNLNEYNAILQEIIDLGVLLDVNKIIIAGDFNTEFTRARSLHTTALTAFMDMQNFTRAKYQGSGTIDQYTYESKITGEHYTIDHILVTENLSSLIKNFQIIYNGDNLSDHHPVSVCIELNNRAGEDIHIIPSKRLLWSAATNDDINMYQSKLQVELNNISLPINVL
jgi:endonuclease/exonuclease/phosphatase family metal-dependent hydrolase